jgi:copper transport protein
MAASWAVAVLSSVLLLIRANEPWEEGVRLGLTLLGGIVWLAVRGQTPFVVKPSGWVPGRSEATPNPDAASRWSLALAVVALLGLLLSVALTGHAWRSSLPVPNLLVALVHCTGAAAWIGGLVILVAVAFPAARSGRAGERAKILSPVVARFSDLAVLSVFAVVASGAYTAWSGIRELDAVTGTTYGWVFLAKLNVFLPALALGAVNNRWTKPRLMRAAHGIGPARPAVRLIRRLVVLEVALVAVVLGLTAFLVRLPPPSRLLE